jgi:hypothetical protein
MVKAGSEGNRLSHALARSEPSVGSSIPSTLRASGMIFFNLVEGFFFLSSLSFAKGNSHVHH